MKPIGELAGDLLEQRHRDFDRMQSLLKGASSPKLCVTRVAPALADVIPDHASREALAAHAPWELASGNARAQRCRRCSAAKPPCDGATGYYSEGLSPAWRDGRIEPTTCDVFLQYKHRRELRAANVPEAFLAATFETYRATDEATRDAKARAERYAKQVARGHREAMVLVGDTGVGKTHLAIATLQVALRTRPGVVFWYVPDLVQEIRRDAVAFEEDRDSTFERAANASLLVLDDLGAERPTDFARERIEHLINRRWSQRLPVVITQNVPIDSLESLYGHPVMRRIMSAMSDLIEFTGKAYVG